MTEFELIEALQQKSEDAFKVLVDTYAHMVYNTVLGIVQHEQEAEDITQEVFIQVFVSIKQFRQDSKLSTWLYRIATTKSLDRIRKRKAKKRFGLLLDIFGNGNEPDYEVEEFNHPGVQLENKEQAALLFKALRSIPENQRVAFVLIKTEGLNYQETAFIMNTSVKSVEAYMHRAKINLRKILEKNNL